MLLSRTMMLYLARSFALWFAIVLGAMFAVIFLIDGVELLRRAAGKPDATLGVVTDMVLLRLPHLIQETVPFAILFGGILAFLRLTRHHELTVLRSAGVSVWQFMVPALVLAVLIGTFKVMAINPLASVLLSQFERLEGRYLSGRSSLLAVSSTGLWLREIDSAGNHTVVAAKTVVPDEMRLEDVTFYLFEGQDRFQRRIDARLAVLTDGYWRISDGAVRSSQTPHQPLAATRLPTELTSDKIQESFASPETVSFWQLPRFIRVLEETGFSATPHRLQWHALLAEPLLLMAMILIAATFSLRPVRQRGTVVLVAAGILAGLVLHVMTNVVHALGLGASIPVTLAAWAPAGISLMVGLSMLMHLEDG